MYTISSSSATLRILPFLMFQILFYHFLIFVRLTYRYKLSIWYSSEIRYIPHCHLIRVIRVIRVIYHSLCSALLNDCALFLFQYTCMLAHSYAYAIVLRLLLYREKGRFSPPPARWHLGGKSVWNRRLKCVCVGV
jgi:hypothetical protein